MMETLIGTSLCKENKCVECISRLACSFNLLLNDIIIISRVLNKPIEELFPSLEFHKSIINGE